jgi:NADP-dependent aldehyde dehydrogenase
MTTIQSIDPRQGVAVEDVTEATSTEAVTAIADLAAGAAPELARLGRGFRAKLLRAISDGLESARETIVKIADRETAIGPARLNGELTRTAYQARLFADVLDEGSYLEATIDHAGDTPMGPGPDLRRLLVPIGPVAVFGSSNFPLAFSVPGGDTVSAIAAGCPVIVKAHTSHPATSRLAFEVLADAAKAVGAPEGTFGIVFGQPSGSALVADPRIKAVGFTGSLGGGRALLDIIDKRREPIPFYGELASLNPVVITDAAAAARGADIADGLVTSVTVSAGQLCTKPGLVFIPEGPAGDGLTDTIVKKFSDEGARVLLNERIFESYEATTPDVQGISKLEQQAFGLDDTAASGFSVRPRLFITTTGDLRPGDAEECFGRPGSIT